MNTNTAQPTFRTPENRHGAHLDKDGAARAFEVVVRDGNAPDPDEWSVIVGPMTPREARTRLVREAGLMANVGWSVVGLNRGSITVDHANPDVARVTFRIRKVVP